MLGICCNVRSSCRCLVFCILSLLVRLLGLVSCSVNGLRSICRLGGILCSSLLLLGLVSLLLELFHALDLGGHSVNCTMELDTVPLVGCVDLLAGDIALLAVQWMERHAHRTAQGR